MRIEVQFTDRVGIAHEILAVLARRRLNVAAVEVSESDVYIDAPDLAPEILDGFRPALLAVPGVRSVGEVDVLPGARRRLHLDALLDAMADPVMAVDGKGGIVVGNAAAASVTGIPEEDLAGTPLGDVLEKSGFYLRS